MTRKLKLWVILGIACLELQGMAQPFIGVNSPGASSAFTMAVPAGVTNLSLTISNSATAYSYLYLRKDGAAATNNYDFAASLQTATNSINLEVPQLVAPANYSLLVYTPPTSTTHNFKVAAEINREDAHSLSLPMLKPVTFTAADSLSAGQSHFFQVNVPANMKGWRIVLSAPGAPDPNLYVQRGGLPSPTSYLKQSMGRSLDTIFLDDTELAEGVYYILVTVPQTEPGTTAYTLSAEPVSLVTLPWEPGTSALAAAAFTNTSTIGGDYFFKITTLNAASGVWRTRLDAISGQSDLWLRRDSLPNPSTSDFSSRNPGSDGIALIQAGPYQAGQYQTGQVWYAMVTAAPGAQWSLYSGNLYVTPLPAPAADDSSSTNTVIAPEGMNFYRATINTNTLAWKLGLSGLTNNLYVRKGAVAHNYSRTYYQWAHPGQLLLVPPYLQSAAEYFVLVSGKPGEAVRIESRQQPIIDLPFGGSTPVEVGATNYGYVTFRVPVPAEQIGWQLDLRATRGDPALAVRESAVANEYMNTAFSTVTNDLPDSIVLVPPILTDGSYYVTVWGKPPYSAVLSNSQPTVSDVPYAFTVTNNLAQSLGWRFYRVADINQQLSTLGWELLIGNCPPGTELAIRRNAMPGRWNTRTNLLQSFDSQQMNLVDFSSTNGFLQHPRHPADVWYIGVNHPIQPLGPFILQGHEISRLELALGPVLTPHQVTDQRGGLFQYFRIQVPDEALGLDVQLANVTSGEPRLAVCRGMLPIDLRTILVNSNSWTPNTASSWPIGAQVAYSTDWTGFTSDGKGAPEAGRFFFAGRGNPLETGTYYVGVINNPANTNFMSYQLLVRGIFPGQSVAELPFTGSTSRSNVPPHNSEWHRIVVPEGTPNWKFRLTMDRGDASVVLRQNGLPNYGAGTVAPATITGAKLRKVSNEHFLLLPELPETNVLPGTYYVGVVSEGENPSGSRAGTNVSAFTLTSEGSLLLLDLGQVDPSGLASLTSTQAQQGGEIRGFRFQVATNTAVIEVRLRNREGNPQMALRADERMPRLPDPYGYSGGDNPDWTDDDLIRIPKPKPGNYTLLVQATPWMGGYSNVTYQVEVFAQRAEPVDFDQGQVTVTDQPADGWRYFAVSVPTNALGWDLRLTNVVSGSPRLAVCRGFVPVDMVTRNAAGGSWNPYAATNWPARCQIAPDRDWTGYSTSALGANESGWYFMASMGNPLEPGDYIVGVASRNPSVTNQLAYQLVSRGIGTNLSIPVIPLAFTSGAGVSDSVPPHEALYYRVDIPTNTPSWQVRLGMTRGDALMMVRREGLPNYGAAATTDATNLAGCKLQKTGNEHYALIPEQPFIELHAGTYYFSVVSEGISPSGARIGSNTCAFAIESLGPLPVEPLGRIDSFSFMRRSVQQEGGSVRAWTFDVAPGTLAVVARLENKVGNPTMTLRAGDSLPLTQEIYGRQGGWPADLMGADYLRVKDSSAGGKYMLMIHAGSDSGMYPDASYVLEVYSLVSGTEPLDFDGGEIKVPLHLSGEWRFFGVDVPTNAVGWDLRLKNINSGYPRLVVCRSAYPTDLTSRLPNGGTWYWGSATNWPVGAQAAPGVDWTGYRYDTNGVDTSGTIFVAGMRAPLEPGRYVVGVSSAQGTSQHLSYTIASRGIGKDFKIPVTPLDFTKANLLVTNLDAREAAFYSFEILTNTAAWKLRMAPSTGDAFMVLRKDALPNITAATNVLATAFGGGHKFQKQGIEHAFAGWPANETNVIPGTYYVGVVGEGRLQTPTNALGGGLTDFALSSRAFTNVLMLGDLGVTPDLMLTNQLEAGETAACQFLVPPKTINLEVTLSDVAGNALMRLRGDRMLPLDIYTYGQEGGYAGTWESTANKIIISSPKEGAYVLTVAASGGGTNWPPLNYTLRIHADAGAQALPFDGGKISLNGHANSWRMFMVSVPSNTVGWDLRLVNVKGGSPRLAICRDQVPVSLSSRKELFGQTTWPSGAQIAPESDWTGRLEPDGKSAAGRIFQAGMGNPLQAGVYYVGVTNTTPESPAAYTIWSRGIGDGFTIPITEISFSEGGQTDELPVREAAWYRVEVPNNTPSWKAAVYFDQGDGLLLVQRNAMPNLAAAENNSITELRGGKKMQKPVDEHLLLLGSAGDGVVPPGTYYIGVVSEGMKPDYLKNQVGTNTSWFSVWSEGVLPPIQLGHAGARDLVAQLRLQGGESRTWQFDLATAVLALEVAFEEPTGSPMFTMTTDRQPPSAPIIYGSEGGALPRWTSGNVITLPNASPTNFSMTVQATGSGQNFPPSDFRIRVRNLPVGVMSFSPQLNTAGQSNTASALLQDGHKSYYRVQVPEKINDQPVAGWKLSLGALYGVPTMRVRKGALPDTNAEGTSAEFARQAVFVADYLTPGTWYVEITAAGLTYYTVTSESLELDRPAWLMPPAGGAVVTPGLPSSGPVFGDTGILPNGQPLPDDQGIDLEQGSYHYYAVIVPAENNGLLSSELTAISGNPNLYLRWNAAPTLSHKGVVSKLPLYDRALTNAAGTEYGNWVVLNGRSELSLTPGLWFLAVNAGSHSAVRYRLRLSTGDITPLAYAGGHLESQALAAGNWRYYRVQLPKIMADTWTINFRSDHGRTELYVRDTIPPGQGEFDTDYLDWQRDLKNHGPYPYFTEPGDYTLTVPPVRPGTVYYLGVRAVTDASFSIASTPGTSPMVLNGVIPFADGVVTEVIPGGGVLRYRVDVPRNATQWTHTSTHPSSVRWYLEQGTLPTMSLKDHWSSSGPNSSYSAMLYNSSWPWLPGYSYFFAATNTSPLAQTVTLRLSGIAPPPEVYSLGTPYMVSSGNLCLTLIAPTNEIFWLQSSLTLTPNSWVDVTNYLQTNLVQTIILPVRKDKKAEFFRLAPP